MRAPIHQLLFFLRLLSLLHSTTSFRPHSTPFPVLPRTKLRHDRYCPQPTRKREGPEKKQQTPSAFIVYAADGGDDPVPKALNILRHGARIFHELESQQVDEAEAEKELQKEEKEMAAEKAKLEKQKQKDKPTEISLSTLVAHSEPSATNEGNNTSTLNRELGEKLQARLEAFDRRAKRTRLILLKKVASWAFDTATDAPNQTTKIKKRSIDRSAFYSGILLVHLHLSKYVGVAACHPPTRDQIDELFELADKDRSGTLNEAEFTNAVVVACAPITSRMAVYWSLLAILPLAVGSTMGGVSHLMRAYIHKLPRSVYQKALVVLEWSIEYALSLVFFSILVPNIFSRIDRIARQRARQRAERRSASTTLWWLKLPKLHPATLDGNGRDRNTETDKPWVVQLSDWVQSGMTHRWSSSNHNRKN
jgi:hypothetical protein